MQTIRKEMTRFSHKLYDKGFVANHDGNISCKLGANEFLATPTAQSKGDLSEKMLITVDNVGKKTSGDFNPFSEIKLHLLCYNKRPKVNAVVHAHPPYATALSLLGRGIDSVPIAEAIVTLGDSVPFVPYSFPGNESPSFLDSSADAFIFGNHGVLALGESIQQAYYRLELVEHLAKIIFITGGSYQALPKEDSKKLLQKHNQVFGKKETSQASQNQNQNFEEIIRKRVIEELSKK